MQFPSGAAAAIGGVYKDKDLKDRLIDQHSGTRVIATRDL